MAKAPLRPQYANPAQGGVVRAIKGTQVMGRATDQALSRRMKLNDALGKFRGK